MNKFTSILAAALVCGSLSAMAQNDEIRVTPATDPTTFEPSFQFNKDYKYYGILLDDETKIANLTDDQYVYIGPDKEKGRNLWMWNGFDFPTTSMSNSFGVPDAYTSVKVQEGQTWSGLGYNIAADHPVDLSGITSEYTFHIALSSTSSESFDFYLTDGNGNEAHLVFGKEAFGTNAAVADFERDGEWYNIDIPMTYLEDNFGFSFNGATNYANKNILCLLGGGVAGTTINYDAVFFYGPAKSTGVNGVKANATGEKTYYTVSGSKVSADFANANKGIYVVKQGNESKKVVVE